MVAELNQVIGLVHGLVQLHEHVRRELVQVLNALALQKVGGAKLGMAEEVWIPNFERQRGHPNLGLGAINYVFETLLVQGNQGT